MKKNLLLLLIPSALMLAGCTQEVNLNSKDTSLVNRTVTQTADSVIYPDDNPSVPDGKLVYDKMNCAQCHGLDGSTQVKASAETLKVYQNTSYAPQDAASRTTVALNDKNFMAKLYPLDTYIMLSQGKNGHQALRDKLSRRQIWNLVFYTRSLAVPLLTAEEWAKVDPVWGSNCAVCHGKRGHGDGPLGKGLDPVPANFHTYKRFYQRTDDQIFDHIAYGIKWEGMPNFLGKVDKKKDVKFDKPYIRTLVQYVRNFGESNIASTPETASSSTGGGGVGQ